MTVTRASLIPHPSTPAEAVHGLGAHVVLTREGSLSITWVLRAALDRLALPPAGPQRFRDGLWKHTCFEAFVAADGGAPYREFNFAPSHEWAAYAFSGPRTGMTRLESVPQLATRAREDGLELDARIDLTAAFDRPWNVLRLGLAAVLEAADGTLSYWALRHPADKPDFHHRGGFMLSLS